MKARNAAPVMLKALREISQISTDDKVLTIAQAAIAEAA